MCGMSRSALIFSLVIHASVLAAVGWSSLSTATHAGLGIPEAGVMFSTEDAGGLVLEETTPAVEIAPPKPEPTFEPPAPVIDVNPAPVIAAEIAPPTITATTGIPQELPPISPAKKERKNQRSAAVTGGVKNMTAGSIAGATGGNIGGSSGGNGGIGYLPPQFLLRYKPPYPEKARAQRLAGTVLLLVSVDAAGHVTNASLQRSCGHAILDHAALAAVRSWRFSPARQMDHAVAATVEVPIRFSFSD
jgi:protein TonB